MGAMNEILGMKIAEEHPQDIVGIRQVNLSAFGGNYEADVVDRLRLNCPEILSLVAIKGDLIVGHVLFSPVRVVQRNRRTLHGMGLQHMREQGYPFVIVLGRPSYYPRFGFTKASDYGITSSFENVPDEAFMIRVFDSEGMQGVEDVAYYRPEFDE